MAQRVLIIGGGMSGQMAAKQLQAKSKTANITIIQAEDFNEWHILGTYSLARPETHPKSVAKLEPCKLPGVQYEVGLVTEIKQDAVVLGNGKSLPYDVCVLAVGYSMPLIKPAVGQTWEERSREVQTYGTAIRSAKCVAIIGAGPVGVELAGDVREVTAKEKRVVLISRGACLPETDPKIQQKVEKILTAQGVEVVKGELVDKAEASATPKKLELKDGTQIEADVVIPAFSGGFQTSFLTSVGGLVDARGRVIVNEYLQSPVQSKLFAVGCANLNEFVGIPKIEGQAMTVAANIKSVLEGKEPSAKHKENLPFMKVPAAQIVGHETWAMLNTAMLPPPLACCARIGFPCCPPPCCWFCCCSPCCCGGPCQDPEGKGMASFLDCIKYKLPGKNGFKQLGELAPAQMTMA